MMKFLGEDERFLKITQRTDELLTKRSSGYVAAEKCRDRAMAYYERGWYLYAIKQLHQAKIQWFSGNPARIVTGNARLVRLLPTFGAYVFSEILRCRRCLCCASTR